MDVAAMNHGVPEAIEKIIAQKGMKTPKPKSLKTTATI